MDDAEERVFRSLTRQERMIMYWLVNSYSTAKLLAWKFGISQETIKRHLSNIFDKTGMDSSIELAIYILRKPGFEYNLKQEVERDVESICKVPNPLRSFPSCGS